MRAISPLITALLIEAVLTTAGLAQIIPAADAPQPLSPEESLQRVRLPEGFQMKLVASEPVVTEPSCIAFDEHGSLFVCELHGYNVEGHIDTRELNKSGKLDTEVRRLRWELMGGPVADEAARNQFGVLKKLKDTDADGVMDTAAVWADDLPPCYGILPARGGILVTCAPDIIFFADRDGDGMPEIRETLFTGFDIRVLERGINNPIWGLDNWIYIGGGGEGGTITGPNLADAVHLGNTDFRIRPDGTAIEPVNGRVGTFGMTMNDLGDRFPSTGGRPAVYALPLPYHYLKRNPYVAMPGSNHTAADYNRGYRISEPHPWRVARGKDPEWIKFYGKGETSSHYFSGGCSTTFYGDSLFPEKFQGDLFYCEPSLNIVHRAVLKRNGAGYIAERSPDEAKSEFLASTDQWFRPMNLRTGPDGALYIVDMYREIIEDYSAIPRFLQQQYGLDKGNEHGRIWRLAPTSPPAAEVPDLSSWTIPALVDGLNSSHAWMRRTAQRLLYDLQTKSARPALSAMIGSGRTSSQAVIAALYTLRDLNVLEPQDVAATISHQDHRVRLHGLRVMKGEWLAPYASEFTTWFNLSNDPDPSVRLQFALTLGDIDDPRATTALAKLAQEHAAERWMQAAILSSANNARAGDLLTALLSASTPRPDTRALLRPLSATIAGRRDYKAMAAALTRIAKLDTEMQVVCLSGFIDGLKQKAPHALGNPSDKDIDQLTPLLKSSSPDVLELAVKVATYLPATSEPMLERIFRSASAEALNAQLEIDARRQAIRLLAHGDLVTLEPVATELLTASQPPALQQEAIEALGKSPDPQVGTILLQSWPSLTPGLRDAVMKALLDRENRANTLLDAIAGGTIQSGDLTAVQKEQLSSNSSETVASRAQALFSEEGANAELAAIIDRYQKALTKAGDATQGEVVFVESCQICHQLNGKGNAVGPALGSIANQPDESILLDILDPAGKIDPEYKVYLVTNRSGQTFAGMLANESPTSITLRTATGEENIVLRGDIASMTGTENSLMPTQFHTAINAEQMVDLIAFLRASFTSDASAK